METTTAHHHSYNNPVDLWEALKLQLPTTILSWQPQLILGSMSAGVIQEGRPQQLLPPGRGYVLKTDVNYVLDWHFLHQ